MFPEMGQRMLGVEKLAVGADCVNQVKGQGFVVDLHRGHKALKPANDLFTDDQLGQRAGQARFQIAQVVNQIGSPRVSAISVRAASAAAC